MVALSLADEFERQWSAKSARSVRKNETIEQFVERASGGLYKRPTHLRRYTQTLQEAIERPIRVVFSTPPQHGKTLTTQHALALMMERFPRRRFAYVTYSAERAEFVSLQTQGIATETGLKWQGTRRLWKPVGGGGMLATGIGGPLTGFGIDGILVVDDPIKNRREAESSTTREAAWNWFTSTAITRCHPCASIVVMMTRWHPDDLAGRCIDKLGWKHINLPAINDGSDPDPDRELGAALWEEQRPKAWLESEVRPTIGEYDWASLYQGQPRPRGGAVFQDPQFFEQRPAKFSVSIGADFAYSKRTHADYSVAVVVAFDGTNYYVLDVVRDQVEAPAFAGKLRSLQQRYGATISSYIGGTEKGIVDFLKAQGIRINAWNASAKGDKFTRAQSTAAAWNAKRVLLPTATAWSGGQQEAPWLDRFIAELTAFTGVNDPNDDQVDALVAAVDAASVRVVNRSPSLLYAASED